MSDIRPDGWHLTVEAEHYIELECVDCGQGEVWRDASAKWDGCVQYGQYFNRPKAEQSTNDDDVENVHLCSLAEAIGDLLTIAKAAYEHFDGMGYDTWSDERNKIRKTIQEHTWL